MPIQACLTRQRIARNHKVFFTRFSDMCFDMCVNCPEGRAYAERFRAVRNQDFWELPLAIEEE